MSTHTLTLAADRQVMLTVDELGSSGQPFLLLHGGAGTQSMTGFAQKLVADDHVHVYLPTHPGFSGTLRPDWLNSVSGLADLYIALIEQFDLHDVVAIGNSVGGWITAEMAIRSRDRISRFILIDAAGIVVEGPPVVNISPLSLEELSKLSYHNPAAFRIDPSTITGVQKRIFAGNRQTLAVYGGSMVDPTLFGRLSTITAPGLVLWGDSDGIFTPDYGRAYTAIPTAKFQLLANVGHLPQIADFRSDFGCYPGFRQYTSG